MNSIFQSTCPFRIAHLFSANCSIVTQTFDFQIFGYRPGFFLYVYDVTRLCPRNSFIRPWTGVSLLNPTARAPSSVREPKLPQPCCPRHINQNIHLCAFGPVSPKFPQIYIIGYQPNFSIGYQHRFSRVRFMEYQPSLPRVRFLGYQPRFSQVHFLGYQPRLPHVYFWGFNPDFRKYIFWYVNI